MNAGLGVRRMNMMRPIENAPVLHAGQDFEYPALKGCPDCGGRGWLWENPFAEYNRVTRACPTCWDAKKHFDAHGELPADITAALTPNVY